MTIDQILKGKEPPRMKINCEGCGKVTLHNYEGHKFTVKQVLERGQLTQTEKLTVNYKCSKCTHIYSLVEKRKIPEDSKQSREYPQNRRKNGD